MSCRAASAESPARGSLHCWSFSAAGLASVRVDVAQHLCCLFAQGACRPLLPL